MKKLLEKEANAILNIPTANIEIAINLIFHHIHVANNGKVIVFGMGKAGQVGNNIATTLSSTGTPAIFLHPSEAQHGDLGIIQENDILLAISNSGKTREVLELIDLSENLISYKLKLISIVGNKNSQLAKKSDCVLFTGGEKEICPLNLTPTISTTTMMVIGDLLVVGLMKKIKFKKEDYAKRHHGGYLGRKASNHSSNF